MCKSTNLIDITQHKSNLQFDKLTKIKEHAIRRHYTTRDILTIRWRSHSFLRRRRGRSLVQNVIRWGLKPIFNITTTPPQLKHNTQQNTQTTNNATARWYLVPSRVILTEKWDKASVYISWLSTSFSQVINRCAYRKRRVVRFNRDFDNFPIKVLEF